MNIKKIGYCACVTGIVLSGLNSCMSKSRKEEMSKNMEYVRVNAPHQYPQIAEEVQEAIIKGLSLDDRYKTAYDLWAQKAKIVRDSLKIDSIAKKNYKKGVQVSLDSIKALK